MGDGLSGGTGLLLAGLGLAALAWFATAQTRTGALVAERVGARSGSSTGGFTSLRNSRPPAGFLGGDGIAVRGLTAGVAVATIVIWNDLGGDSAWWLGAGMIGAVAGLLSFSWDIGLGLLCLVATWTLAQVYAVGTSCTTGSEPGRALAAAALTLPFLGGIAFGFLGGSGKPARLLRVAGPGALLMMWLAKFAGTPRSTLALGFSIGDGLPITVAVLAVVAVGIGYLVSRSPGVGLGLLATLLLAGELWAHVLSPRWGCSMYSTSSVLVVTIAATVCYWVMRKFIANIES